jgi:hypothetical protein
VEGEEHPQEMKRNRKEFRVVKDKRMIEQNRAKQTL